MYAVYFLIFVLALSLVCFIGWSIEAITSSIRYKKECDIIWNTKVVNWFIDEVWKFKFVKKGSDLLLGKKYYIYYEWDYANRYRIILWIPEDNKPNVSVHTINSSDCVISTRVGRKENDIFIEKLKEIIPKAA